MSKFYFIDGGLVIEPGNARVTVSGGRNESVFFTDDLSKPEAWWSAIVARSSLTSEDEAGTIAADVNWYTPPNDEVNLDNHGYCWVDLSPVVWSPLYFYVIGHRYWRTSNTPIGTRYVDGVNGGDKPLLELKSDTFAAFSLDGINWITEEIPEGIFPPRPGIYCTGNSESQLTPVTIEVADYAYMIGKTHVYKWVDNPDPELPGCFVMVYIDGGDFNAGIYATYYRTSPDGFTWSAPQYITRGGLNYNIIGLAPDGEFLAGKRVSSTDRRLVTHNLFTNVQVPFTTNTNELYDRYWGLKTKNAAGYWFGGFYTSNIIVKTSIALTSTNANATVGFNLGPDYGTGVVNLPANHNLHQWVSYDSSPAHDLMILCIPSNISTTDTNKNAYILKLNSSGSYEYVSTVHFDGSVFDVQYLDFGITFIEGTTWFVATADKKHISYDNGVTWQTFNDTNGPLKYSGLPDELRPSYLPGEEGSYPTMKGGYIHGMRKNVSGFDRW